MSDELADELEALQERVATLERQLAEATPFSVVPVAPWQGFAEVEELYGVVPCAVLAVVYQPANDIPTRWIVQVEDGGEVWTTAVDLVMRERPG